MSLLAAYIDSLIDWEHCDQAHRDYKEEPFRRVKNWAEFLESAIESEIDSQWSPVEF